MAKTTLCLLLASILVAACTTPPNRDQHADRVNAAGADVQCHSEQATGSMFSKTVCTTQAQRDAAQADAENLRKSAAQQGGCRSSAGTAC
jgi:uncharacterized lipoprotein YajG